MFRLTTFVTLTNWVRGWNGWLDAFISLLSDIAKFWDTYIGAWDFIPAFIAGLAFCVITTWDRRGNNIKVLTKSMIEGAESVMPAVLLMLGIGMLLMAVWNRDVSRYLQPIIRHIIPTTRLDSLEPPTPEPTPTETSAATSPPASGAFHIQPRAIFDPGFI